MKKIKYLVLFLILNLVLITGVKADDCSSKATIKTCETEGSSCIWTQNQGCISTDDISNSAVSCKDFSDKGSCTNNTQFACVWVEDGSYCNYDSLQYIKCGAAEDIPLKLPEIVSFLYSLLKIAVPIILVVVSLIELVKAITASKEDEIEKAKAKLIKKIIAAVLVFFVFSIVQFVITKVADTDDIGSISSCLDCFLNGECDGGKYYITNVDGNYIKTYINK